MDNKPRKTKPVEVEIIYEPDPDFEERYLDWVQWVLDYKPEKIN